MQGIEPQPGPAEDDESMLDDMLTDTEDETEDEDGIAAKAAAAEAGIGSGLDDDDFGLSSEPCDSAAADPLDSADASGLGGSLQPI